MGNKYVINGLFLERFIDRDGQSWVQSKKCNKCGRCCEKIHESIKGHQLETCGKMNYINENGDCRFLKKYADGVCECTAGREFKPLMCIVEPSPELIDNYIKHYDCSIRWVKDGDARGANHQPDELPLV